MQLVNRFDLRLTLAQEEQILEKLAPHLIDALGSTGQDIYLSLNEDGSWQLHLSGALPKVFDRLTGRRWEWHGTRLLGVVHSYGAIWQWRDGRYYPASLSAFHSQAYVSP